ncbi:MAG: hypothetical protein KDJ52_33110 [Anaerolineae bacterium]|nr:hypothetical protein [Anaerolineae bacterium]
MPELNQKEEVIYYQSRKFLVSNKQLRTPRKTYRIFRIEKISLRRDILYFSLPICLLVGLFIYNFNGFLYREEILAVGVVIFLVLSLSFYLGVLHVESKAISEPAAISSIKELRKVRAAVENAMSEIPDFDERYER